MNKKDILLDRFRFTPYLMLLFVIISDREITPWNFLLYFIVIGSWLLITSQNYLIHYKKVDANILFTYKITLSDKLHHQEIRTDSIKKAEFHSKTGFWNRFNTLILHFEDANKNPQKFHVQIQCDSLWFQIIKELV